jgi:hypothetical protein
MALYQFTVEAGVLSILVVLGSTPSTKYKQNTQPMVVSSSTGLCPAY